MNTSQQFLTKYDQIYVMLLDLDWSPHRLTSITNVVDYSTIKKIVDGFFDWFFNGRLYCVPLILYNQPFSISIDEFLSIRWQVPSHTQHSQALSWKFIQLFPMIIVCKTALWIMDYLMHPYLREKLVKGRPFIRSLKNAVSLRPFIRIA